MTDKNFELMIALQKEFNDVVRGVTMRRDVPGGEYYHVWLSRPLTENEEKRFPEIHDRLPVKTEVIGHIDARKKQGVPPLLPPGL